MATPASTSSGQPLIPSADLANLTARATSEYAHKRYTTAAELYSQAVELQALQHGEMATSNADLLYAYGRCLYKAAVEKSDVLGGKAAEASADKGKKRKADDAEAGARKKAKKEGDLVTEGAGTLQFEGDDEEWEDDEDEEDGDDAAAAGQGEDEEDDDFAIAYEILELARVLFERRLEALTADDSSENGAATDARSVKEVLADIHDLQAEIHLESEQFTEAVNDVRACLKYKEQIHPFESSHVAEAHFKLSLSLEFASKTAAPEADGVGTGAASSSAATAAHEEVKLDEAGIKEAAEHMEEAIKSTKQRHKSMKEYLTTDGLSTTELAEKTKQAGEIEEVVAEMEERLQDLRAPPESLAAPKQDMAALIGSLMGGENPEQSEELKKRLAAASAGANDLSSLVKKKVKKPDDANGA